MLQATESSFNRRKLSCESKAALNQFHSRISHGRIKACQHLGSLPLHLGSLPLHLGSLPLHRSSHSRINACQHIGSLPLHPGSLPLHLGPLPLHLGPDLLHCSSHSCINVCLNWGCRCTCSLTHHLQCISRDEERKLR